MLAVRWQSRTGHALDDQTAFALALDIQFVSLAQELDVLLQQREADASLRSIDEDGTNLG